MSSGKGRWETRDCLLSLIDGYKYGTVTAGELCSEYEKFRSEYTVFYVDDENLKTVNEKMLPEVCQSYINWKGDEKQRDLEFWKGLKDCEHLLRYNRTFTERIKSYIDDGIPGEDPVEYTDRFLEIEPELEKLIRDETGEGGWTGFCHTYWRVKKRILKEKYGIDWESPAERYPTIFFD